MSKTRIAAFDVDGVVVDLSYDWWEFLQQETYFPVPFSKVRGSYDFTVHYPDLPKELGYSFWKCRNLYDYKEPVAGAQEAVERFHDAGFDIIFVSHIEGDHGKSKFDFLKKYFPYMKGYMASREKGYIQPCIAFDDRLKHLAHYTKIKPECITVHVENWHDQDDATCGYEPDYGILQGQWTDTYTIDYLISKALEDIK